ncbi:MAG TPA: hypothetical protein VMI53_06595 [Opitutaceae bacterium]|nr:hypothetical protein [Opitutaceae bacterium]
MQPNDTVRRKMRRAAKIVFLLGAVGMVAFVAFVLFAFRSGPEERAQHLAHVAWLPAEASDVTYVKRDGFGWVICYDCKLPKEALDRLAQKEGWKLVPKNDVTTGLRNILCPSPPKKKTDPHDVVTVDLGHEPNPPAVRKALFYENRHPNGGGVTVIYDLDTSRLFVHKSHN